MSILRAVCLVSVLVMVSVAAGCSDDSDGDAAATSTTAQAPLSAVDGEGAAKPDESAVRTDRHVPRWFYGSLKHPISIQIDYG